MELILKGDTRNSKQQPSKPVEIHFLVQAFRLTLNLLSDTLLQDELNSGKIDLAFKIINNDRVSEGDYAPQMVLTASTQELQNFIKEAMSNLESLNRYFSGDQYQLKRIGYKEK